LGLAAAGIESPKGPEVSTYSASEYDSWKPSTVAERVAYCNIGVESGFMSCFHISYLEGGGEVTSQLPSIPRPAKGWGRGSLTGFRKSKSLGSPFPPSREGRCHSLSVVLVSPSMTPNPVKDEVLFTFRLQPGMAE
jgi:hypothetical protein